jgi:hypothetical protein
MSRSAACWAASWPSRRAALWIAAVLVVLVVLSALWLLPPAGLRDLPEPEMAEA